MSDQSAASAVDIAQRSPGADRRVFVRSPVTTRCIYRPIEVGEGIPSEAAIEDLADTEARRRLLEAVKRDSFENDD